MNTSSEEEYPSSTLTVLRFNIDWHINIDHYCNLYLEVEDARLLDGLEDYS